MELNKIKLLNNNVLVKIENILNEKIKIEGGGELLLFTGYSQERHASIIGEIAKLPDRLIKGVLSNPNSLEWETDIEAEVGDKVWMNWDAILIAAKNKRLKFFIINDEKYIIINYKDLYVGKRGDEEDVVCYNGYCLIEALKNIELPGYFRDRSRGIINTQMHDNKLNPKYGRLAYAGTVNSKYYYPGEDIIDSDGILPGDLVMLSNNSDVMLEYPIHTKFDGKKIFYRVHRHQILAKIDSVEN